MEAKKKILIVDDDIDVITVIETILTKQGYEVFSAMNKKEGIEMLRSIKPNLAILDVMMTTPFEGFELAQEILTSPEFKDIPFLMQSSIDIFVTSNTSIQALAHEFRQHPEYKDLQVLLLKNITDGSAGIDYRDENGKSHFFPVKGFVRKPVDAKRIIPEIERHIR